VSIITVGELYYGAENSTNPKKHFKLLDKLKLNQLSDYEFTR
jgi:predicted nucleic acid-binding protein